MKQYILKVTGTAAILGLLATGSFAQDTKVESTTTIKRNNDDLIIIKSKTDVDTKLTIEIKGEDVKVNGKPLPEYKSDDVSISTHKQLSVKEKLKMMQMFLRHHRLPAPGLEVTAALRCIAITVMITWRT